VTEKSDANTAYHEAGHAVVGEAIEPGCVESLTIQVDNEERSLGSTQFSGEGWEHLDDYIQFPWGDPDIEAELRECAAVEIMRCLGGPLAEKRFTGSWDKPGAWGDLSDIFDLVAAAFPEDLDLTGGGWSLTSEIEPDMDRSLRRARELWEGDTQDILTEHWSWVEAVAQAALDGDGNLTGDEIRALRPPGLADAMTDEGERIEAGDTVIQLVEQEGEWVPHFYEAD
jgi:hypothetical protein